MKEKLKLDSILMIRLDKNTHYRLNELATEYSDSKSSIVRIAINKLYNDFKNQK